MKNKYLLVMSIFLIGCNKQNVNSQDTISFTESEESSISIESNIQSAILDEKITEINFQNDYLENEYVKFIGKTYFENSKGVVLTQSNTYFEISFIGSYLKASISASSNAYISIFLDDNKNPYEATKIQLNNLTTNKVLLENLENKKHTVKVFKINEANYNSVYLSGINTDGKFLKKDTSKKIKIEYFGDSITCGFGAESTSSTTSLEENDENSTLTYAFYASLFANADFQMTCASGWGMYAGNGGNYDAIIPPYINYCDFEKKHPWDTSLFIPDIVVINLGTNDYSTYSFGPRREKTQKEFLINFENSYTIFINNIHRTYGNDVPILMLSDMMFMDENISKAIANVASKNKNCYHIKSKSASVGGNLVAYHPNYQMNVEAGNELIAYFEFLLGEIC